jgi:beta-lactamase class A
MERRENGMRFDISNLKGKIEKHLQDLGGRAGIAILDTKTHTEITINADDIFPAASVIKLSILIEMLFQIQDNKLEFSHKIHISNGLAKTINPSVSSGALCFIQSPISLTVSELAALMIIVSDNVAADILIEQLGQHEINRRMYSLGITDTCLNTPFFNPEILLEGSTNYTTANNMMKLLSYIYYRKVPYADFSLSLLKQQRFRHGLPFLLPTTVTVFNKTGTLFTKEGHTIVNDVGILMLSQGAIIVSFLSNQQDNFPKAALTIASISKMIYEESSKLG